MCLHLASTLGSLLLLFSFVLELFILIGQASNTSFLRELNFLVATNQPQNLTYTTGLWNYCQGDYQGVISSCAKAQPAFNWAQTPAIAQILPNKADSLFVKTLFLAMFCLFFIGCGISFILWVLSVSVCLFKRRSFHFSIGTFTFINFLVMLAALILSMVMIISGAKQIHDADNNWYGEAGISLWCAIGAVVALLLATLLYGGGGICAKKRNTKVEPAHNAKLEAAAGAYPTDTKKQYVTTTTTYVPPPTTQYQTDAKLAQPVPRQQTEPYYGSNQDLPKLPRESYSQEKTAYVPEQKVDAYTNSPVAINNQGVAQTQNLQQSAVEIHSPPLTATTNVPSQAVQNPNADYSIGQVPNTTDTTNNDTATADTADLTRNFSTTGDKTVYVPTDQGPVPVEPHAITNNLQIVDSTGNPVVRP